jgi:hypothetical protein
MPLRVFAAAAVTLALVSPSSAADGHHSQNVTVHTPDDRSPRTCADLEVTFDEQPAATAEEHLTLPRPGGTLNLRAPANGGIFVIGSPRSDFAVTVCKAVAASGDSNATLAAIRPSAAGGTVTVGGPDTDRWIAYLLIEAPREAAIDLEAQNGPLEVRDFAGRTAARTTNGPISLANVSGTVTARAQNGPVKFIGNTGAVDLETQNGPIGVRLDGERWATGSLTAHAQNGPVKVEVPPDFASGVRVASSNHAPWKCHGTACASAKRSWDDGSRWIELGRGPVAVRVATVNGPVAVDTAP